MVAATAGGLALLHRAPPLADGVAAAGVQVDTAVLVVLLGHLMVTIRQLEIYQLMLLAVVEVTAVLIIQKATAAVAAALVYSGKVLRERLALISKAVEEVAARMAVLLYNP